MVRSLKQKDLSRKHQRVWEGIESFDLNIPEPATLLPQDELHKAVDARLVAEDRRQEAQEEAILLRQQLNSVYLPRLAEIPQHDDGRYACYADAEHQAARKKAASRKKRARKIPVTADDSTQTTGRGKITGPPGFLEPDFKPPARTRARARTAPEVVAAAVRIPTGSYAPVAAAAAAAVARVPARRTRVLAPGGSDSGTSIRRRGDNGTGRNPSTFKACYDAALREHDIERCVSEQSVRSAALPPRSAPAAAESGDCGSEATVDERETEAGPATDAEGPDSLSREVQVHAPRQDQLAQPSGAVGAGADQQATHMHMFVGNGGTRATMAAWSTQQVTPPPPFPTEKSF